ncbi:hypothetical protein BRD20_07090 [Halobacteriales archaeon SW_8_65_20]|nr:MAG: hypothetical protein BRD20_07090 [Halobacteriales archaeon SW_8_65_20]
MRGRSDCFRGQRRPGAARSPGRDPRSRRRTRRGSRTGGDRQRRLTCHGRDWNTDSGHRRDDRRRRDRRRRY